MTTDPLERVRDALRGRRGAPPPEGLGEWSPGRQVLDRDSVYRRMLAVADFTAAAAALALATVVLGDTQPRPWLLLVLPLLVVIVKLQGLYDRDALLLRKTTLDEAPRLFMTGAVVAVSVEINEAWLVEGELAAGQLLGLWLVLLLGCLAGRHAARLLAGRRVGPDRILVVGTAEDGVRIANKLANTRNVNAQVVACVGGADVADLAAVVREFDAHRVIVAPHDGGQTMLDGIRAAKDAEVQVSVLPRLTEVVGSSVEFDHLAGVTVLGVRPYGLSRSSLMIKRAFDVTGALLGLVLLSPLLAVVAVMVRMSSPGPILFRQQRIGRRGEPFRLLKFRTMVDGADALRAELDERNEAAAGLFKIADDPRVTPVGRRLRRLSVDELPQLINVLRGEMSLVGPRPLVPEEYQRIDDAEAQRQHLRPGMTGEWQVSGSTRIPLTEMVTIDYLYGANWSLWQDVKLLCRTVSHVLGRRGQ